MIGDGLEALSLIGDCMVCEVDRNGNPTDCHPCGGTDAQQSLARAQLLARRRKQQGHRMIGADDAPNADEIDSDVVVEDSEGLTAAVNEIMGVSFSDVTPYLSAIAQGAQGFAGDDKAKAAAAAEEAKKQAAKDAKEAAEKQKSSKTTLYVVLGVLGATVLGVGGYFVARKK